MEQCLSLKQQMWMTLYRQGVRGLREKLVLGLPAGTEEWAEVARDILSDADSEHHTAVVRQLLEPGFVEHHPHSEALIESLQDLMTSGSCYERRAVTRFAAENLRLFPIQQESFQLRVMGLQTSADPITAEAAEDLLEKMGIDLRDPALFGDSHDSMQL